MPSPSRSPHPLEERIAELEKRTRGLDRPFQARQTDLKVTIEYGDSFLERIPKLRAFVNDGYDPDMSDDILIPGDPTPLKDLLHYLDERVNDVGLSTASGGHMGFIPGGGIYESALGDYLAAITNRYSGVFYAAPGAVRIENTMVRWTGQLIGYSGNFGGNLTTGGSIAALTAIVAARHVKGIRSRDVEKSVVYATRHTHHSAIKSLKVAGLDDCVIRIVDLDDRYRMDPSDLEIRIKEDVEAGLRPFLCLASAGCTDLGSVDPLTDIAALTQKFGIWLHVDAAYGGYFILTEYGKKIMSGLNQADSVILDPHKGLGIPYGTGVVLVKEKRHLLATYKYDASYLQDIDDTELEESPSDVSIELSRHFRGLRMWLPLKLHGVDKFRDNLDEKLLLIRYLYDRISELGFDMGPYPELTVIVFRYTKCEEPNELNRKILHDIQEDGRVYISSTNLGGEFFLRAVVLSFRTHKEQVDLFVDLVETSLNRHLI